MLSLLLGPFHVGINAAVTLEKNGEKDFLILEGTDRIGGRVKEAKLGDLTIEVGANW